MYNELDAIAVIVAIGFLFIIKEALLIYLNGRRLRQLNHRIRVEQTKAYFAELRSALLEAVNNAKISPNSATFQSLYQVHTLIMRNPDKYQEISHAVQEAFVQRNSNSSARHIESEKTAWSAEVKQIAFKTGEGLFKIVITYSSVLRLISFIYSISKKMTISVEFISKAERKIERSEMKKKPEIKSMMIAQQNLHKWAT